MRVCQYDLPGRQAGQLWIRFSVVAIAALLLALLTTPLHAEGEIVRIEEDWELVVSDPDPTTNGPQIMTVFSPCAHVDHEQCLFLINHRTMPDFTAGGLQLQVWDGDEPIASRNFPYNDQLSDDNETIRWTQTMKLSGSSLAFEINNGTSNTWGAFGGQGYLKDSVFTSEATLSNYDPEVSAKQSGVTFASNRVTSLILKEVRWYSAEGLVAKDTTARVVHQQ